MIPKTYYLEARRRRWLGHPWINKPESSVSGASDFGSLTCWLIMAITRCCSSPAPAAIAAGSFELSYPPVT